MAVAARRGRARCQLRHLAGDQDEAERLVRDALRIYRLKLSEEHPKIVGAKRRLAEILMARRRPQEAEPLLLECHEALASAGAGSAKELAAARKNLVELYESLGKPALAEKFRALGGTPP